MLLHRFLSCSFIPSDSGGASTTSGATVKGRPEAGCSVGLLVTVPEEFSAADSAERHRILPPRAECLLMPPSPAQKTYSQESDKFTQLKNIL